MEILGIGPVEFIFIIIILLLVLGPTELGTLGRKLGEFIRKVRMSETWVLLANLARTIRNLPTALADEVGVDEIIEDVVPGRNRRTIAPPRPGGEQENDRERPRARADAYPAWTTPPAPPGNETDDPESRADSPSGGAPESFDAWRGVQGRTPKQKPAAPDTGGGDLAFTEQNADAGPPERAAGNERRADGDGDADPGAGQTTPEPGAEEIEPDAGAAG